MNKTLSGRLRELFITKFKSQFKRAGRLGELWLYLFVWLSQGLNPGSQKYEKSWTPILQH